MSCSRFVRAMAAFLFTCFLCGEITAAPGDTTWVTVFNLQKLTKHGNYDTTAVFPQGKRYRKIRMHYILGRYACPPGTQYCGSWDYTTQIFAMPAGKDTVEIGRVITPYATDWLGLNKTHDYILDVTDYASVLEGSTGMRFRYDGYSWGFTITLKLELIEGIPPMDAVSVENIYSGYFDYGNTNKPIENKLVPTALTYTTPRAFVRNTVTGHGADNTGCSEFCSKYYQLFINGGMEAQRQLWRADCGVNQVYPQTGTWVFNRANWCPGAIVNPIMHDLEFITSPNTTFTADINMQPYTISNPSGGYIWVSQLISYSAPNFGVDAAIEDIATPTKDENHFRDNPACMSPRVRVRNTGVSPIISLGFEYGISGLTPSTYLWMGTLDFLKDTIIELPPSLPVMSQTVSQPFEVRITDVNFGGKDEYDGNDVYYGRTTTVQVLPSSFIVNLNTNGSTDAFTAKNQTTWRIFDQSGAEVASRTMANNNTVYSDTVSLFDGCYKLVIDDSGCDGFSWWYYQYYPANPGNGQFRIRHVNNPSLIWDTNGDFGCGITKFFYVGEAPPPPPPHNPDAIDEMLLQRSIQVYPNPAIDEAIVKIDLPAETDITLSVLDISGKTVFVKTLETISMHNEKIDTKAFAAGVYVVRVQVKNHGAVTRRLCVTQ